MSTSDQTLAEAVEGAAMTLREQIAALIEEWRASASKVQHAGRYGAGVADARGWCAEDLAILLASLDPRQDETGEQAFIEGAVSHWFVQGGEASFGSIGNPQNTDELISAILSRVRAAPSPRQEPAE